MSVNQLQRRLGRTDIHVSPVAMGCWAIVGDATWGPQDERDAIAAIHAALDAGVNFFDTAEGYGAGFDQEVISRIEGVQNLGCHGDLSGSPFKRRTHILGKWTIIVKKT